MKTIPTDSPIVYLGVDVAKAELVVDLAGTIRRFANTSAGIAKLLKAVRALDAQVQLICESTAGYERALVIAAQAAALAISVVPPQRVRNFAKALGLRAKSDPIDAALISRFASQTRPKPLMPKEQVRGQIDSLLRCRHELLDSLQREKCRSEHHDHPLVIKLGKARIKRLEKELCQLDDAITELVASDPVLAGADSEMRAVKGVSHQTSRCMLAFLPELGRLNRRQVAALTGLAPYDRDSGQTNGNRYIQAGRSRIRRTLHMAAVTAARYNEVLAPVYRRLRKAGKPFKVAIVAIARKLLIHLNSIMARFLEKPLAA